MVAAAPQAWAKRCRAFGVEAQADDAHYAEGVVSQSPRVAASQLPWVGVCGTAGNAIRYAEGVRSQSLRDSAQPPSGTAYVDVKAIVNPKRNAHPTANRIS
jgi:hypothetical protein